MGSLAGITLEISVGLLITAMTIGILLMAIRLEAAQMRDELFANSVSRRLASWPQRIAVDDEAIAA